MNRSAVSQKNQIKIGANVFFRNYYSEIINYNNEKVELISVPDRNKLFNKEIIAINNMYPDFIKSENLVYLARQNVQSVSTIWIPTKFVEKGYRLWVCRETHKNNLGSFHHYFIGAVKLHEKLLKEWAEKYF